MAMRQAFDTGARQGYGGTQWAQLGQTEGTERMSETGATGCV